MPRLLAALVQYEHFTASSAIRSPCNTLSTYKRERQESFIVNDADRRQLAYLYFEDEPQRQLSTKRLLLDEDSLSR
jgi:hypothetical protein